MDRGVSKELLGSGPGAVSSQLLLFRQEAIQFQQDHRQWGRVALLQTRSTKVISWLIAAAVALMATFLFHGQYARKETVAGYLTPAAGTAKIFASKNGTIKEVFVKEGQQVKRGQSLLTIETAQIAANGQDVNDTLLGTLGAEQTSLTNQICAEQERMNSEEARLSAKIASLETEVIQLHAQIENQREQIRLTGELVSSVTDLTARGIVSTVEYKKREIAALEQRQKLDSLKQHAVSRQNELTEARSALEQLPTITAGKIQNLRSELATTEQRIAEISGRRAYEVRAPSAGRISILQATVGQFADSQRPQMEIVPDDSELKANLFVPAKAIGFVQPGQDIRILYEAFPYQQFGTYVGHVSEVSQTMLTRSETSAPIELKEPAYRVTATLDRPDIDAYGKRIRLQADMLLKADIILEKRSLIRWLLDPLLSIRM
jgi:membrane fusion protein